jgi:hypothetical protein
MSDSSDAETRECKRCKMDYELTDFRALGIRSRDAGVYRSNDCRRCHADAMKHVRRLYKTAGPPVMSCEICHSSGRVVLDHDHETGAFRGWLCRECNQGLGKLGDNIEGLRRALAYLERSSAAHSGLGGEERARSRSPRNHGDSGGAAAAPESF